MRFYSISINSQEHILTASLQELERVRKGGAERRQSECLYHGNFIGKHTKKVRSANPRVAVTGSKAIRRKSVSTQPQFHTRSLIPRHASHNT